VKPKNGNPCFSLHSTSRNYEEKQQQGHETILKKERRKGRFCLVLLIFFFRYEYGCSLSPAICFQK
jgi:hypothetical protein